MTTKASTGKRKISIDVKVDGIGRLHLELDATTTLDPVLASAGGAGLVELLERLLVPADPEPAGKPRSASTMLHIEEVSELTGVPVNTLRHWRKDGRGPKAARFGNRLVYRASDVRAWIDEQFGKSA